MALNKDFILRKLVENKEQIISYGVKKIGLFGSYSKGKQTKNSDLDFLVTFDENTFDNFMDLKFFLEDIFKRKVDLVIEESIKPSLKHIRKEAVYDKGF